MQQCRAHVSLTCTHHGDIIQDALWCTVSHHLKTPDKYHISWFFTFNPQNNMQRKIPLSRQSPLKWAPPLRCIQWSSYWSTAAPVAPLTSKREKRWWVRSPWTLVCVRAQRMSPVPHRVHHGPVQRISEQLRFCGRNLLDQALDVFALLLRVGALYVGQAGAVNPEALVVIVVQRHQLPLPRLLICFFVVKLVEDAVHRQLLPLACIGLTGTSCGTCRQN